MSTAVLIIASVTVMLALLGLLIWRVFTATAGAAAAATEFVAMLGHQSTAAIFSRSPALKIAMSAAEFEAIVREHRLDSAERASWTQRGIGKGSATIAGSIHLKSGEAVPATLTLVEQDEQWLVRTLRYGKDDIVISD